MFNVYIHNIDGLPKKVDAYVYTYVADTQRYLVGKTDVVKTDGKNTFFDKEHSRGFLFPMVRAEKIGFILYDKRVILSDTLYAACEMPITQITFNTEMTVNMTPCVDKNKNDKYILSFFVEPPLSGIQPQPYFPKVDCIQLKSGTLLSRNIKSYLTFVPPLPFEMLNTLKFECMQTIVPIGEYNVCSPISKTASCKMSINPTYLASTGLTRLLTIKTEKSTADWTYGYNQNGKYFVTPVVINEGDYVGTAVVNFVGVPREGKFDSKNNWFDATSDGPQDYLLMAQLPINVQGKGYFSANQELDLKDIKFTPINPVWTPDQATGERQLAMQMIGGDGIVSRRIITVPNKPISLFEALQMNNLPYSEALRFELVWPGKSDTVLKYKLYDINKNKLEISDKKTVFKPHSEFGRKQHKEEVRQYREWEEFQRRVERERREYEERIRREQRDYEDRVRMSRHSGAPPPPPPFGGFGPPPPPSYPFAPARPYVRQYRGATETSGVPPTQRFIDGEGYTIHTSYLPPQVAYVDFYIKHPFRSSNDEFGLTIRGDKREILYVPCITRGTQPFIRLFRSETGVFNAGILF